MKIFLFVIFFVSYSLQTADHCYDMFINKLTAKVFKDAENLTDLSRYAQETIFIGAVSNSKFDDLQLYSHALPSLKFSTEAQWHILDAFIKNYADKKTASAALNLLTTKHGVAIDACCPAEKRMKITALHLATCNACETGNMFKLEAFLKNGGNSHDLQHKITAYEAAWNNINNPYTFTVLSTFIRHSGIQVPRSLEADISFQQCIDDLKPLSEDEIESDMLETFDMFTEGKFKLLPLVFTYKSFFSKKPLSSFAQKEALTAIVQNHNSELGKFLLNITIKYGLDLNKVCSKDKRTYFEYIVDDALEAGNTMLFEEALFAANHEYKKTALKDFLSMSQHHNASKLLSIVEEFNQYQMDSTL